MTKLDDLLKTIESLMIGAGEICPDDYQSGFDWKEYTKVMHMIKDEVRKFAKDINTKDNKSNGMVELPNQNED